jgi:hypothetical protein
VPAITPPLEQLRDQLGFYISAKLLEQARAMAGE